MAWSLGLSGWLHNSVAVPLGDDISSGVNSIGHGLSQAGHWITKNDSSIYKYGVLGIGTAMMIENPLAGEAFITAGEAIGPTLFKNYNSDGQTQQARTQDPYNPMGMSPSQGQASHYLQNVQMSNAGSSGPGAAFSGPTN